MKNLIFLTLLVFAFSKGYSQRINPGKEALTVPLVTTSFGLQAPIGDLSDRFGLNGIAGIGFTQKLKSNWTWSVEGNIIFGSDVREDSLLRNISADFQGEQGLIINNQGTLSDVVILERGFTVLGKIGRIFPLKNSNPNSGLYVQLGGGFFQHKIRYQGDEQDLPWFDQEMKKGYDRMSNGPCLYQFIGYSQLSSNRKINFFIGLEAYQSITSNRRGYNYDTRDAGLQNRFDGLIGIKAGWQLPLYKRVPTEFYYD